MMSALIISINMIDHNVLLYSDPTCSGCFSSPFVEQGISLRGTVLDLSLHSRV